MAVGSTSLTINLSPAAGGSYVVTGLTYSYGGSGAGTSGATYGHLGAGGVATTVTVTPANGYTFVNWTWTPWTGGPSGGGTSTSNPLAWTQQNVGTIQANFSGSAPAATRRRAFIY